jgi:hypothetical protein
VNDTTSGDDLKLPNLEPNATCGFVRGDARIRFARLTLG